MHASVVTLFPELFGPWLESTVVGRAQQAGTIRVETVALRAWGEGKHKIVDDRPFGGGPGMVLLAEPVLRCVEATRAAHGPAVRTILLSPQGRTFTQAEAQSLADAEDGFILICGRYEGIDERAIEILQPEELSLGDFVLSGGEAAALAVLDAAARLVPGVLGHPESSAEDSFSGPDRLLDHPHYTRPAEVRGLAVPEVLRSGDHAAVARWRHAQALARTAARRPDLLPPDSEGPCTPAS